jgi:iron complex outermembrane recepter protein
MDREVSLDRPDTTYIYDIIQPFPTLNLSYDMGKGWSARAGYSRRIERTTTFKMTPFPEREHNETLEQGDAELLPEFIDLVELGLNKNWGDNSVFATIYYRGVENVINRVNTVYNDTILNRIYTNSGDARAIGLELGGNLYPTKWCQIYLGGNVYNYQIKGVLFGDIIDTDNVIYSINANAEVDLHPTLKLQAAFNYLSERVTAQGVDSRFYNPSLTLRKTFLDGKVSAALQWLSIDLGLLESNEQRITTVKDNNFFTTTNYVYEVDRVLLSLSFQLNQPSKEMKFIKSEFGEKEF